MSRFFEWSRDPGAYWYLRIYRLWFCLDAYNGTGDIDGPHFMLRWCGYGMAAGVCE